MGTEYQIVNNTTKQLCGFGLDWNPKHGEILLNQDSWLFAIWLITQKFKGDHIAVISEGNSWDWGYENPKYNEYKDISKELYTEFINWRNEETYYLEDYLKAKERGEQDK